MSRQRVIRFAVLGARGVLSTVAVAALTCVVAEAAIAEKSREIMPPVQTRPLLGATREALGLPITSRLQKLQAQGPQGYKNLVKLMFDDGVPMEMRWRAVTAAAALGGKESRPELERALARNEWFMRNAGLIALANVDRQAALKWARKLMNDKALVVRAAAVETITNLKDTSAAPLLWEKLYARENYKGQQSLFIRRHIVLALGELERPGHEAKFIEVLQDRDELLHAAAIAALENLTHQTLGDANGSLALRRSLWQKWWREKAQAKL